jgi:hypothetical protein
MACLQIPKLTEWMTVKGKAAQWLDRDQPEIISKKFQLVPLLLRDRVKVNRKKSQVPRPPPRQPLSTAAAGAASKAKFLGLAFHGIRLQRRSVKIVADQTCAMPGSLTRELKPRIQAASLSWNNLL